jgi:nucleoside-diphosphate-sugar epimerase
MIDQNCALKGMKNMSRIIITGANGFIGSLLAQYLQDAGHQVRSLVRHGSDAALITNPETIRYIDYNDLQDLMDACAGYTVLIHTAALTKARTQFAMDAINVGLTEKLIDVANRTPSIQQFLFISSQAATGPAQFRRPKTEDDLCTPISWYGKSKLKAEQKIHGECRVPYTIIRPCSVFGPGEKDFLQMFSLIKHRVALFPGYCQHYLNLIFVEDLIACIALSVGAEKAFNQTFHVTDGYEYTNRTFAANMKKAMNRFAINIFIPVWALKISAFCMELTARFRGKPALVNRQKVTEMLQQYWLLDCQKAKDLLGYAPWWDQVAALKKTYQWYKEHSWL